MAFRVGVLVSGRGTNLQALINASKKGVLSAEIAVVISNNPKAPALERAQKQQIPTKGIDPRAYPNTPAFEEAIVQELQNRKVDLVILAGFMKILSSTIIRAFPQRIINIHPALLPSFPGLHVQRKAIEHGVRFSGCTVHFVDESVDGGPIIIQAVVPLEPEDTEETLAARILKKEHQILPRAVQWIAKGRVKIEGRKVTIAGIRKRDEGSLTNPPLD
ncbi:MAG: phosphoribosylglycinamide formyltransferase [Deltaproteobacteria bacterium]|nr:phosphoribosylglycinamide formyltransferase [Deltaproteobacteria bacterium]